MLNQPTHQLSRFIDVLSSVRSRRSAGPAFDLARSQPVDANRIRPAQILLLALFLIVVQACVPANAQYLSIESHSDYTGLCGSPGRNGCALLPTCTKPSGNNLKDDAFTGLIKCDLPGSAELHGSGYESLPPIFQQYRSGQAVPSDTIFTSTDLHFGKSTVSDADHINHTRMMNVFAASGTHWPRGVGFPDVPMHAPAAIVTTGDNAHDGQQEELGAYRLLYEQGVVNESANIPVLIGLGNHDVGNDCYKNNCARRMFDYENGHVDGGVTSFDPGSDNYSWDWNGVHYIQLNKWAGDTELGSGGAGSSHPTGLIWLVNDLKNQVGVSGRPIILFQHFGLDCFSIGCPGSANGAWWTQSDRQQMWDAITGYNVVAMFSGHVHSTSMLDWNEFGGHLDDFVGGTGGEDPCLNGGNASCGGRGHFFAVRVTGNFLDVASLEWISDTSGNLLQSKPYFTNLSPTPVNGMPGQGSATTGSQLGCRKLINSRIIDVSDLVKTGTLTASGSTITVTNGNIAIPGPLALEVSGLDTDGANLDNKAFVDLCAQTSVTHSTVSTGQTAASNSNSFLIPDNGSTAGLAAHASLQFTPEIQAQFNASNVQVKLVRYGLTKGASPAAVNLLGTPATPPADGTVLVYGPPSEPFVMTNTIETTTANWVSVSATSPMFDRFGVATFTYKLNHAALLNDKNATEISFLKVVPASDPMGEVDVIISLELKTADSISVSLSPSTQVPQGRAISVTAKLSYKPVADTNDGGTYKATGGMNLIDITNPSSPVTLYTDYINNACDPGSDPNCPSQPDDTANFPAQTLSVGVHTLQVTYAGDSFYEPNSSTTLQLEVGQPTLTLSTVPANLQIQLDGLGEQTPKTSNVPFGSIQRLFAPSPQAAPGVRYLFDHWEDGSVAGSISVPIKQMFTVKTATFDPQYQLILMANPASAGTVTSTDDPADSYFPSGTSEVITASANKGYVFTGFTGALTGPKNGQTLILSSPATVTANFASTTPVVTWSMPAAILKGTPLSATQLDATANVAGIFTYSPHAAVLLGVGNGQKLSASFKPTNVAFLSTTASTTIDVLAPIGPTLGLDGITATYAANVNEIVITVIIENVSSTTASGFALSAVLANTPLTAAVTVPNIAPDGSTSVILTFPRSAGASGAKVSMALSGSYSAGNIRYSTGITLP